MSGKRPIISTGGRGPVTGGARRTLPMPARYAINAVVVLVLLVLGELMIDGGAINRYQSTVLEQVSTATSPRCSSRWASTSSWPSR